MRWSRMKPDENSAMKAATTFFSEETEQFAGNYTRKPSFHDRLKLFLAAVQRSTPPPAKVLDFGCGPGVIAAAVARLGYDVLGTDGSVEMVGKSISNAAAAGLDCLQFELAEAMSAKFPAESFGVIVCSSVLEYLPQDKEVLRQLVDSLKLGGSLLVSVPNAWSLIGIAERSVRCLRRFCRLDLGRHFDYSLRHYSPSQFSALLSSLGLEVQRRTSFEFPLFGHAGVRLSRIRALGSMILFEARRTSAIPAVQRSPVKNPMRVVIVRDRISAGGGIHNYYQTVSKHLTVQHGFVNVGRASDRYGSDGSFTSRLPTPLRLLLDWCALLLQLIKLPDLVHLNPGMDMTMRKSLRRDAVNLILAKLFRRRVIVFWRGWEAAASDSKEFPGGNSGWLSRIYRLADAHIVLATKFRDDLRRWGFETPIYRETTVASDSVLDCATRSGSSATQKVRLLFLSRMELEKGIVELLSAFRVLQLRTPGRFELMFAGDGPALKDLIRKAEELGVEDVSFPGYVTGREKAECYLSASIFCFLSYYDEGMPNAVLEAMGMGLPLVTSDVAGLKDILRDGVTGIVLPPDRSRMVGDRYDADVVANAIERLADSKELCRQIGEHNREYASQKFSAKVVAARLENIYRQVLNGDCDASLKS